MNLESIQAKVASLEAEHRHAALRAGEEREALEGARQRTADAEEAQRVLQAVAQTLQQTAHDRIARIATRCLEAVFGEDAYSLKVEFVRARGKTEARLILCRDGMELEDPLNEASGGMIAVAAFALRIADLMTARPQRRKVILLDEPFQGIHADLAGKVRGLLEGLAREMSLQVILITHSRELACGKIIELE